jgi:hypothetical protein
MRCEMCGENPIYDEGVCADCWGLCEMCELVPAFEEGLCEPCLETKRDNYMESRVF